MLRCTYLQKACNKVIRRCGRCKEGAGMLTLMSHSKYLCSQWRFYKKDVSASLLILTRRKGWEAPLLTHVLNSLADCIEDTGKRPRPGPSALFRFKGGAAQQVCRACAYAHGWGAGWRGRRRRLAQSSRQQEWLTRERLTVRGTKLQKASAERVWNWEHVQTLLCLEGFLVWSVVTTY